MWYLIPTLLESIFPKYKSQLWYQNTPDRKRERIWAILKRRFIFFYRPLAYTKVIQYPAGNSASYRDILMFSSEEDVEDEIDRLGFGHPPITCRVWKEDKIIEVHHG